MAKGAGGTRYSHSQPSSDFKEFRAYSRDWEKTYFDHETGGFVVTDRDRIPKNKIIDGKVKKPNDNEVNVFRKEQEMCHDLAENGHHIEHLNGTGKGKGKTYDIHFDGTPADLKSVSSANNIKRYAKHAFKDQGAKVVIFRLENHGKNMVRELQASKKYGRILYYYQDNPKVIHEIK